MNSKALILAIMLAPTLCGQTSRPPAQHPEAGAQAGSSGTSIRVDTTQSVMRSWIERYQVDRDLLQRRYAVPMSESWRTRQAEFLQDWVETLRTIDFDGLAQHEKIDFLLLRDRLRYDQRRLERDHAADSESRQQLPFAPRIEALVIARQNVEAVDGETAAEELNLLQQEIRDARQTLSSLDARGIRRVRPRLQRLRGALREWFEFYSGFDPMVTWWCKQPYQSASSELSTSVDALDKQRAQDDAPFRGEPIGRDALMDELALAMLPYTPEELIQIAQEEFTWCDTRMAQAAKDLGFEPKEWQKALDHVKSLHVGPGEQPAMIKDLALEAIDFVESRKLVTVPEFCKRSWRMTMLSAERQKTSPYFLGGETIQVAFPTDSMDHEDKRMSMRGNNPHFARATVHHELIPGHHLQGFMNARHRTYRKLFRTPFWTEGWALYWETLLWDLDFQRSAEDRVGMLFWRMHRCARIVFSLSYHLGTMSEQECIDYLVERVGHERNNATAEVRRSVIGGYGPLYQAAYMLGALQLRALRREAVDTGRMTELAFHDAILRENAIPIELVRASLTAQPLTRDYETSWRFREPKGLGRAK